MASPETFDIPIGKVVGPKGDTGNGIKSIALLSTSGLSKTYRITMTDDTTFDFTVTDGNGISGATFDAQTNELTLTFDNGTTFTTPSLKGAKGDTGNGISRIEKTGTADLVDTYTVTYTDGQTFSYTVTNGADGVSPEVTVTQISGGHTVEIEDADGVKTFDVLDGEVTETRLAEALATKAPVIIDTASGAIATFTDGADSMPIKKLVAQIEPVQDLHGYENPWPAGGGKNKANINATFPIIAGGITITKNEDGSITINGTTSANVSFILMTSSNIENGTWTISGVPANSAGGALSIWARNSSTGTEYARTYNGNAERVNITTGTVYIYCTIDSGTVVDNVKVYLQLEAGSTATAWTPYANICPISGHTGAEISGTGINIWDEQWESGAYNNSTGAKEVNAAFIRCKNKIPVLPSTTYYFKCPTTYSSYARFCFYDIDENFISYAGTSNYMNYPFTTPSNARYMTFWTGEIASEKTYNHDISINYPATDTQYHTYTGDQISVDWEDEAGTVYGGSAEVIDGKLVNDAYYGTLAGASVYKDNGSYIVYLKGGFPTGTYTREGGDGGKYAKCNITNNFGNVNTSQTFTKIQFPTPTSGYIFASIPAEISPEDVQFCYELAEPAEYTLPENEMDTLYGQNNIWCDTGDVEVTYPADTKLYIDRKIAEALGG